nr:FAD-dependent urate hydroxylase-like [Ipomoea batatas]
MKLYWFLSDQYSNESKEALILRFVNDLKKFSSSAPATEKHEIVIIGGGICGLATALALHRKGLKSIVLERSETLRAQGGGIGLLPNAWRALDQLGVGSRLRSMAVLLQGGRDILIDENKERKIERV